MDMQGGEGASHEDLEVRIAHQEKMLADLNEIVTDQWRRIDLLERQVRQLREDVRNMTPPREGDEPPPPHY